MIDYVVDIKCFIICRCPAACYVLPKQIPRIAGKNNKEVSHKVNFDVKLYKFHNRFQSFWRGSNVIKLYPDTFTKMFMLKLKVLRLVVTIAVVTEVFNEIHL